MQLMRSLRIGTALLIGLGLALALGLNSPLQGADLVCSSPQTISAPTTYENVTIASGCVLTLDTVLTVNQNMTLQSGGSVTHSLRQTSGLTLNVTGVLDVQLGGVIDVSAKGLRGGQGVSNNGETFNASDQIVAGAQGGSSGAGAGYGGLGAASTSGAQSNAAYGLLEDPHHLGSGGGAGGGSALAGDGGGRVKIIAGSVTLNGSIRANGGAGAGAAGGGSGGAIRIDTGALSGAGTIQANGGGTAGTTAGTGAGGRIALYYDTRTFSDASVEIHCGSTGIVGAAGTIYLKDNAQTAGDLIVDNGAVSSSVSTPLKTALSGFRVVTVRSAGQLGVVSTDVAAFSVTQPVSVMSGGVLTLGAGVTMNGAMALNGGTLRIANGGNYTTSTFETTNFQSGTVAIDAGGRLGVGSGNVTVGSGVTLVKDGALGSSGPDSIGSVTVLSGGLITHSPRLIAGLSLNVTGLLDVQSSGLIDASAKGLRGGQGVSNSGETFNTVDQIVAGAQGGSSGAGAGYGGPGANSGSGAQSNTPYGLLEDPHHLGSGGGAGGGTALAGDGGGRVSIVAGSVTLNGSIRVNGGAGAGAAGGGSGGAIRIDASSLSGSGTIQANGGSTAGTNAGTGGGGRIAVYYDTRTFSDANIQSHSGGTGIGSAAGTLFFKDNAQSAGDLIVDNASVSSGLTTPLKTALLTFRSLTVRGAGQLGVVSTDLAAFSVAQPVSVTSGGVLTLGAGVTMNGAMALNGGTLRIPSGGSYTASTFDTSNFLAGTVALDAGGRLGVTSGNVTVGLGVTLVKDGAFGLSGPDTINSITVLSGGVITHSLRQTAGLVLNVAGVLDVQGSGSIDASAKGLRGGQGVTNNGETFNASDQIVAGAQGGSSGAGAGYGGLGAASTSGAQSNAAYGLLEDPHHLGSGGGAGGGTALAGDGGGRVKIAAGSVSLNGSIRANGGAGGGAAGGGSGGAIRIDTGTLSGAGTIQVNGGGTVNASAGTGGGGRVAVYYDTRSFADTNIQAHCGSTGVNGASGTIYLKDNAEGSGDLIIDNGAAASAKNTPLSTSLASFRSVKVRAAGRLEVPATNGSPLAYTANSVTIDGTNSVLLHSARAPSGLRLSVAGALTLQNGGKVSVDGLGLLGGGAAGNAFGNAGETFALDGITFAAGSVGGSGGSYGGLGGGATPNPIYDTAEAPNHVGSGGSRSTTAGTGGAGGGRIYIDAASCGVLSGTAITANGSNAVSGTGTQGGGSGGSIRLDCGVLHGSGNIAANGGAGAGTNGNGGGAGRIHLQYNPNLNLFTGTITASGGARSGTGQDGATGTVVTESLSQPGFQVYSVVPSAADNSGLATLTIYGASLDPAAQVALQKAGQPPRIGYNVSGPLGGTELTARFNLKDAALGLWDVVVTNPDMQSATRPGSFEIKLSDDGGLYFSLTGVEKIRPGRPYVLGITYGNRGGSDIPAPLLQASCLPQPLMRIIPDDPYPTPPTSPFEPARIQLRGIGPLGATGILPPHSEFHEEVQYLSPSLPPHYPVDFVLTLLIEDSSPINWSVVEAGLRPPGIANDAWAALLSNLQSQIGTTWGDYQQALSMDTAYLSDHGVPSTSVALALQLELARARAELAPPRVLATAVDDLLPSPGRPLVFTRVAPTSIQERFRLGPLGRGWYHGFEMSLTQLTATKVQVHEPGGIRREFVRPTGTTWVGGAGDHGVLTETMGGGFFLRETDGIERSFDTSGALQYIQDRNGNRLTLTYAASRLNLISHSSGQSLSLTYSPEGRLRFLTDSTGYQVEYVYDAAGEHLMSVVETNSAATTVTGYSYNPVTGGPADHALAAIAFPGGTHQTYMYDARGRLASASRDGGAEMFTYSYIEPGEVDITDGTGAVWKLFIGARGEILQSRDPLGNSATFTYDGKGQLTRVVDPAGKATTLAYDSIGHARRIDDPLGGSAALGFKPDLGTPAWIKDENGRLTDFTSDPQGNITSIAYPQPGLVRSFAYNATGGPTSITNRRLETISFLYDGLGRVTHKGYPDGRTIEYTWDARSNLLSATDSLTGAVGMTYDGRDLLTRIDYPGGLWFEFTYDNSGRRTRRSGHDGFIVNYDYDAVGRRRERGDHPLCLRSHRVANA
jgi:YD repeat-containing protein